VGGDVYQTLWRAFDFGSGLFSITATVRYGQIRLFRVYQELQMFGIKRAEFVQLYNFSSGDFVPLC
jgi:hypothetical protein